MSKHRRTGELEIIDWLRKTNRAPLFPWVLGVGDDAAILSPQPDRDLVFTTDMVLEDACFLLDQAGPKRVGRKALAVNLSDLAAMGASPVGCLVSLALPSHMNAEFAKDIMSGILDLANQFDCPVTGGDTNTWKGALAVSITAIGEVPRGKAIRRDGAKPGDILMVTGPLGGSILGHHLGFTPRLDVAGVIRESQASAMIDISDGLSLDLWRLCEASGCGAVLEPEKIPITPAAHLEMDLRNAGLRPATPLEHALTDGEDFELLFAIQSENALQLLSGWPNFIPRPFVIGKCSEQEGLYLQQRTGLSPLKPRGWEHSFENQE